MCPTPPVRATRSAVSRPFQAMRTAIGLSRPSKAIDREEGLLKTGRAPLGPLSLNGSTSTHMQHPRHPVASTAYGSFAPQPVDGDDVAEVEVTSNTRPPLHLGRAEIVKTQYGPITVLVRIIAWHTLRTSSLIRDSLRPETWATHAQVSGDRRKTALLTCHDVQTSPQRCLQGLLMRRKSPLVERFWHVHVVLPGFEEGAHAVPSQNLPLDSTRLTRMIAAVAVHYGASVRRFPNEFEGRAGPSRCEVLCRRRLTTHDGGARYGQHRYQRRLGFGSGVWRAPADVPRTADALNAGIAGAHIAGMR